MELNTLQSWLWRATASIRGEVDADIRQGNTMRAPAFVNADGSLRRFRKIAANPMWNQSFTPEVYENDGYHRFALGAPPLSSADWGWLQHMYASLEPGGRMAVVLDTGAASRGSGNKGRNAERDIRNQFVDQDAVECVILLPENLFFNTSAPGIILVATRAEPGKQRPHAGEILLINASKFFVKGRPKNELTEEQVAHIGQLFLDWRAEPDVSVLVSQAEVVRNDCNLSPSRYVASNDADAPLPLEEALVLLAEAEETRAAADARLGQTLAALGLRDRPGFSEKPGL